MISVRNAVHRGSRLVRPAAVLLHRKRNFQVISFIPDVTIQQIELDLECLPRVGQLRKGLSCLLVLVNFSSLFGYSAKFSNTKASLSQFMEWTSCGVHGLYYGAIKVWTHSAARMGGVGDVRTNAARSTVPRAAIVRGVPESFVNALSMAKPSAPIDLELAKQQHAAYVNVLKGLVQDVIELPADNAFPDCPFVEDTAVVIGSRALITCPGAPSRQGEVAVVRDALKTLGVQTSEVRAPSLIDGGDVLYAGGMLFVGKSKRTNEDGIRALAATFDGIPVIPIEVPQSLHLKTVLSSVAVNIIAVEDTMEAKRILSDIQTAAPFFKSIILSPAGAANTLLIGNTVIYPSAYGKSFESTYDKIASRVVPVNISEFHKADGGLTCLSILIS